MDFREKLLGTARPETEGAAEIAVTCTCQYCRYGHEMNPDGRRPPAGTVWCGRRKTAMGQKRELSCFVPLTVEKSRRCRDCKWAKMLKPSGQCPVLGNIWCEKRHFETNKLRTMECFE
ncbi:MAG: hypothetical protein M1497_05325 [Nitrospirae bacterium]|nr:hypothetical protein [Nitrospirota bacterium]